MRIGRHSTLPALIALALAAATASAQDAPAKIDPPPPPAIDDPGVAPPPPGADRAQAAPVDQAPAAADPLSPLPKPDTRIVRDKAARDAAATRERVADSDITQRKENGDTVEEYRRNGHVWMIKIHPANGGPVQTFMDSNGNGRLNRDPREGPVSPVYYTLYEWN